MLCGNQVYFYVPSTMLFIIPVLLFLASFDASSSSHLHVTRLDTDAAQGRYISNGFGIVFNSTKQSLNVSDLFGNNVLAVMKISPYQQLIIIQENCFVQVYSSNSRTYRDYYIPQNFRGNTDYFSEVKKLSLRYHNQQLQKAVEELLNSVYNNLMSEAVHMLGNNLTIYGNQFPSILPLYLVVNMLERAGHSFARSSCVSKSARSVYNAAVEDSCFEYCPPCPEDECLSLCGYGCHCWKWVCGDCCYHLGCYGHDVCCRKNFIQTKCLFPISFRCETEYYC